MAKVRSTSYVTVQATITFEEPELRALKALTGYGIDSFLEVFYEKLGRYYMEPHEAGLRALFKTVNPPVGEALSKVRKAREVLED